MSPLLALGSSRSLLTRSSVISKTAGRPVSLNERAGSRISLASAGEAVKILRVWREGGKVSVRSQAREAETTYRAIPCLLTRGDCQYLE